jgi:ATP synthase I subunit
LGHTWDLEKKIYKNIAIVTILVAILLAILLKDPRPFVYGLVFGTLISVLNFRALALTIEKAVHMSPERAQAYATSRYFLRFIINGLVIFISIKADYIHVVGTIIGMFTIKFVIFVTNLFNDISFFKRIFIRKEEK